MTLYQFFEPLFLEFDCLLLAGFYETKLIDPCFRLEFIEKIVSAKDLGRVVDVVMVSLQGSLEDHLALASGSTTSADMSKQSKHMYFTKEEEGILQNIEGVGCNIMNPLLLSHIVLRLIRNNSLTKSPTVLLSRHILFQVH